MLIRWTQMSTVLSWKMLCPDIRGTLQSLLFIYTLPPRVSTYDPTRKFFEDQSGDKGAQRPLWNSLVETQIKI